MLDFGLVRVDRQVDKSAADSATLAGLHGLNLGDGTPHPYVGVCTAIRYLKMNHERFSGVDDNQGWTNGLNAATGNGCSNGVLRNRTCSPTDKSSWARWHWTGSSGGVSLNVKIESGYSFTGSDWQEDALPASAPDTGDAGQAGCDHLAVSITQSRSPGLGSLATDSDLRTRIRSVGRVQPEPGDSAPAMLLLKRTGCPVLRAGNSGGGSGTFIHVLGAVTSNGLAQPGTIHADSDGSGCSGGSNSNVYIGAQNAGVVAYAAPLVSNPTSPDPAKPGFISSVAAANGAAQNVVRDNLDYVYGSSQLSSAGTKHEVSGRSLVTRRLIDERYRLTVRSAVASASSVFATGSSGPIASWKTLSSCNPNQAAINALSLTVTDMLYVNCNTGPKKFIGSGDLVIPAGVVYFRGSVNPSGNIQLPNATRVYVENSGNDNAIDVGTGGKFQMHTASGLDASGYCTTGTSSARATLFLKTGPIKESGTGLIRLCRTTVFMMGGQSDGCVPATSGTAPTSTPCSGATGTGQFVQTGGDIDWTAPNSVDASIDATTFEPLPVAQAAWQNVNGPEDLALWAESGSTTSTNYTMTGGGLFRVRGVFMVPNAEPFTISGGASLNLQNAQYIATSIELNGGTQITMSVDPNSAVTLPGLGLVGLIR